MLQFLYHREFRKDYKKLSSKVQKAFAERIVLFAQDPFQPLLRDHALHGDLEGKRAFSINGDIRVVYRVLDKKTVMLLRVGTHNQVY